jgi:hypothetical protein
LSLLFLSYTLLSLHFIKIEFLIIDVGMDNNQHNTLINHSTMQPTTYSRYQFLREVLELSKQRMMSRIANTTTTSSTNTSLSLSISTERIYANLAEIVVGVGYILVIIAFLIKLLLQTIRKFEYYYMSPSYNRFGFIANEESESESESDSSIESPANKCLHLKTPVQIMNVATPQTPLPPPLRRSLRLKIKSELNLCAMQNNSAMTTRSQAKQKQVAMTISSDPCPTNYYRSSSLITPSPSPHPEHDEERAYYIQYCNEKKMRKTRPEFNSPLFIRRLVL